MTLTYRHFQLTVVPLIDETVALFRSFSVVSGTDTSVRVSYVDSNGGTALADLIGTGLTAAGGDLTGGTVASIRFFGSAGTDVGLIEGLGLTAAALDGLGAGPRVAGKWLMGQDWSTNFTHAFQQASDHPAGSTLASGLPFDLRGDDYISLSFNADAFFTGRGDDILYGRNGNDTLDGGRGNDTIKGNENDDVLRGGAGDDDLYSGPGNDRMVGGTGADAFVYEGDFGSFATGLLSTDVITDFTDGIDVIRIEMAQFGVTGMDSVTVRDKGENTLVKIAYSSGGESLVQTIKLLDVDRQLIDAADFVFL
jgi:Ca2+-binding RTX toxin-like protein